MIPAAKGFLAQCPAHDDNNPSLSVSEGFDGRALINCFGGCELGDVLQALGLRMRDLFEESQLVTPEGCTDYFYTDESGKAIFVVRRDANKKFVTLIIDEQGELVPSRGVPLEHVLYNLPAVRRAAVSGREVYLVEGEKDAETLITLGVTATTKAHGATGTWYGDLTEQLRGCRVVLIPDNDETGRKYAGRVYDALTEAGIEVSLRKSARGKDVTEHIEAGLAVSDLTVISRTDLDAVAPSRQSTFDADAVMSLSELRALPAREELVEDLIDRGDTVLLFGDYGTFKSFFALGLAMSVGSGRDFHGRAVCGGSVLYVATEALHGYSDRAEAWTQSQGRRRRRQKVFVTGKPLLLHDAHWGEDLGAYCRDQRITLVIVDTLGRSMAGMDENSSSDINNVLGQIEACKRECPGLTIVLVHHIGKSSRGEPRGSSALPQGVDVAYRFKREPHSSRVQVVQTKSRDHAPIEHPLWFELEPAAESAVLREVKAPKQGATDTKLAPIEELLRDAGSAGLNQADVREAVQGSAGAVSQALNRLVGDGRATCTQDGRRKRYYISAENSTLHEASQAV